MEFLASYLKFGMFSAGKNKSLNLGTYNLACSVVSFLGLILLIFWSPKNDHSHKSAIFAYTKPNCPEKDENMYEIYGKHIRNHLFFIFCNSYTYSHPFLANLVLYKQIWPIYGYSHISMTKKQAKLSSNLKQLKKEDLIFPTSNFAFFLLNTSQTEDRRPKIPN